MYFLVVRILQTIFFWVEKRKKIENEEYLWTGEQT